MHQGPEIETCIHNYAISKLEPPGIQGATQPKGCGKLQAPHLEASCNNRECVRDIGPTCLAGMLYYMFGRDAALHVLSASTHNKNAQNWKTSNHDYSTQNWDHLAVQGPPGDQRVHQGTTQSNDCGLKLLATQGQPCAQWVTR